MVNKELTRMIQVYRKAIEDEIVQDKEEMIEKKRKLMEDINNKEGPTYIPPRPYYLQPIDEVYMKCNLKQMEFPKYYYKKKKISKPAPMRANRAPLEVEEDDHSSENEEAFKEAEEIFNSVEREYFYPCNVEKFRRLLNERRINTGNINKKMADPICNCTLLKRGTYKSSGYISDFEYSAFYGQVPPPKTTRKKPKV